MAKDMTELHALGTAGKLDSRREGQRISRTESAALGWGSGATVDPQRQMQVPGTETHDKFQPLPRWEDLPTENKGNSKGSHAIAQGIKDDFGVDHRVMRKNAGALLDRGMQRAIDNGGTVPEGRDWYGKTERNRIAQRAQNFGLYTGEHDPARGHLDNPKGGGTPYETAAAMVAATSPQVAWSETPKTGIDAGRTRYPNIDAAEDVAFQESNPSGNPLSSGSGAPRANLDKAARIYTGEDPHQVLGGKKVQSFNQNLTHPWREDGRSTVDVHAVNGVTGLPADQGQKLLNRKGGYESVDRSIRSAARERMLAPEEAQSIIWHQHKHEIDNPKQAWRHGAGKRERVVDDRQLSMDL